MKKILHFLSNLFLALLWTWIFVWLTDILFILLWNFDFTSAQSWQIVINYWNNGGVIKTASDITLFIALLLLPLFWYFGWRRLRKVKFLQLAVAPINMLYRLLNSGSDKSERIVIRNIKSSQQRMDDIKSELDGIKPAKNQSSQGIRSNIINKRTN